MKCKVESTSSVQKVSVETRTRFFRLFLRGLSKAHLSNRMIRQILRLRSVRMIVASFGVSKYYPDLHHRTDYSPFQVLPQSLMAL